MPSLNEWIRTKVEQCSPHGARGRAGLEDLVRAVLYFDGKSSQLFGLAANRGEITELDALRAEAVSLIRRWYDELASEPAAQRNLFEAVERHGLRMHLPEPESLIVIRALELERDRALSALGTPSDMLPADLRRAVAELRAAGAGVPFASVARALTWTFPIGLTTFEWLPDAWAAFAMEPLDPAFLPLAGIDGDYLGVLLDDALLREHQVPIVYYFHERSPTYTWLFESCTTAADTLRAIAEGRAVDRSMRGVEHSSVTACLAELSAGAPPADPMTPRGVRKRAMWNEVDADEASAVLEKAGLELAVMHLRAGRLWNEGDAKLRAAGAY